MKRRSYVRTALAILVVVAALLVSALPASANITWERPRPPQQVR